MGFQGVKGPTSEGDFPVNYRPLPGAGKGGEALSGLLFVIAVYGRAAVGG
jgi:hypothetical protein